MYTSTSSRQFHLDFDPATTHKTNVRERRAHLCFLPHGYPVMTNGKRAFYICMVQPASRSGGLVDPPLDSALI